MNNKLSYYEIKHQIIKKLGDDIDRDVLECEKNGNLFGAYVALRIMCALSGMNNLKGERKNEEN